MKTKMYKLAAFLLAFVLMVAAIPLRLDITANQPRPHAQQMRGVWVTSAYNLDWPSRHGLTAVQIRAEIDTILNRAASMGLNSVFVQVRPAADALYPSEIFPWSAAFTGVAGQVPDFYANEGFDPLAYWIDRGRQTGIAVHAWLNPYRVTYPNENITDPNDLPEGHPVRENPSLAIAFNNALFLDPGNPAARQLIIDGVAEIMNNYSNIAGIHLDDYFYPSRNFPDAATFARYDRGFDDIHYWRRDNVNTLIQSLQTTVRDIDPRVRWGISPTAIWMNASNDPRGSDTRGSESYHAAYADTRRWVQEGWVDYIVPQIYWHFDHPLACYDVVLSWWESVVEGTGVDLYVGLAPYREATRLTDSRFANWTEGEIVRQLQRNSQSSVVRGAIFFRAAFLQGAIGSDIERFYADALSGAFPEQVPTPPADAPSRTMTRLSVAQPAGNRSITDAANFNFFGTAVPDVPVFVNGTEITNRTPEGFFSIFLPLVRGTNTFNFTQAGQPTVTRVITNNAPTVTQPATMASPAITNVFPASDEWAQAGATLTLRATAPAGATVTARIGDRTVTLTQTNANLTSTASSIRSATFTGEFTLPPASAANEIADLGRPVYTMTFRNQNYTATANGRIRSLGAEAAFFAEITVEATWGFTTAAFSGGSNWMYLRGQTDRVSAITGNAVRLASGLWVDRAHTRTFMATAEDLAQWHSPLVPQAGILSEGIYVIGELEDRFFWHTPVYTAVSAEFDGNELIVALGMQNTAPLIFLPIGETLIDNVRIGTHRGAPAYFMELREGAQLEGFYVEYEEGELQLVLRRRRPLTPGNSPLEGFTFVLDAGHGGVHPGAVGPMGGAYAEKHIVMDVTWLLQERLEMLGAEVVMVRNGDYDVDLAERPHISRRANPDMFISIHSNSTVETTNAANIHGFTMWYRNPNSLPAAQVFLDRMYNINPLTNRIRQVNQANFHVCRPVWTPSILVELSFTNNIQDFAWMIDPRNQVDMAWGMVNAILAYYR